jgi:hypothetical protein
VPEALPVFQKRGDVVEEDALFGKIGNLSNQSFEMLQKVVYSE